MARFDEIYQALTLGGHKQTVIEANVSSQPLPEDTILLLPSSTTCIITELLQTGDVDIATGFTGKDLAEFGTIIAAQGLLKGTIKHLTHITMPTGKCMAISE